MTAGEELILGYRVYSSGLSRCVDEIVEGMRKGGQARWLACLNPHSYAVATSRPSFAEALKSSDWLVPDGIGVAFASFVLGGRLRGRVTGSDIFAALHARLNAGGGARVFLLGATDDTLHQIGEKLVDDWPNLSVAGTFAPPFRARFSIEDLDEMVRRINACAPDVLWVGLSAPKQEEVIRLILPQLNVRFAAGVGAVFDFYTGRVKRSHPIFQRVGLEWLPRLVQQPRRLWRRMGVSAPLFIWHVLRARFRGA